MQTKLLSVVAPVYNEEDVIENVVRQWVEILGKLDINSEIVLTNDGSADKTAEILSRLQEQYKNLKVVTHKKNSGYGKALQDAIRNSSGDYIVSIDSDGQFDLAEFKMLYDKLINEGLDVVTGFRKKKQDSVLKVFADRVLNLIIRISFGVQLKDTNCALKVYKGDILRNISIDAMGYPAPTELLIKLSKMGAKIGEAGVNHFHRPGGRSKLKAFQVGTYMLLFLVHLKYKIFLFNRRVINSL